MAAVANLDLSIRPMTEVDLPEVVAIEQQAYLDPWSQSIFCNSLRVGYSCWCLQREASTPASLPEILGYALIAAQGDEGHVLNICIAPNYQGSGLGKYFLRWLIAWAKAQGLASILLEVRVSNQAAIALYRGFDFKLIGTRKGYYPATSTHPREDALVFALPLC